MMESGYFNNGNFREYSYFAGDGNFAVLKQEFPVVLATNKALTTGFGNYTR